ncbi:MAG: hypothetical protein SGILL_009735, partial [Bacillariaceae sp.]
MTKTSPTKTGPRKTPARPVVRNALSNSSHSRTTGGATTKNRPGLQRGAASTRSVASSNRSLSSKESLHSRTSAKDSAHLQGMEERIKQRAALRASTGISSRSLRSGASNDSKASGPTRKLPTRTSSADGSDLFKRRQMPARSLSSNSLQSLSSADPRRRPSSNALAQRKRIKSPVSAQTKKEVQDLKKQILDVQKTATPDADDDDDDSACDSETDFVQKQLENARQILARNEKTHEDVSPLASPQKSTEGETPNKLKSRSLSTSSIEDMILSISLKEDVNDDTSNATFSTQKLAEIQSHSREIPEHSMRSNRSRLDELRQSRRDQESQLLDMVQKQHASTPRAGQEDDTAVDPTDVMKVIVNLRDELAAAQQVIEQQRVIMEALADQIPESSDKEETAEKLEQISSLVGWFSYGTTQESDDEIDTEPEELSKPLPPDSVPLKQYEELQARFSKLQMDRAWSEFQLRNRITNDALKFHRRLRHWKDQSIELRCEIQNMENDHALAFVAAHKKSNERVAELEK